ncbi:MAG: ATP-binding protein [Candidatus Bathyarchaeia archaeon]|jgi:signal transduction histidine kinase
MSNKGLTFTVDSLLLGEIGERLVTKNYIALAELIKNAFDADSEHVVITMENTKSDSFSDDGTITVADCGHGMSLEQVRAFWMRIATPNKQRNPYSPKYGRRKTGDKGIGRFACRKLANKLILTSTALLPNNKFQKTQVTFNWPNYQAGLLLEEVTNEYSTIFLEKAETGTSLQLIGLRDKWSQLDFDTLRRRIGELSVISPTKRPGYPEDPGMTIEIRANEFRSGEGFLVEQIKDAGWGRVVGSVSSQGLASLTLDAKKIGKVPYELPNTYAKIPNISFDIAIFWDRTEYLRDPKTLMGGLIPQIFKNYSGIKVFLDGFRVYPYGDPENDWLNIDEIQARKLAKISDYFNKAANNLIGVDPNRAKLNHPRNQNLIGEVRLSNEPTRLFDVPINREGFIENESLVDLKKCLKDVLEWVTLWYAHYLYLNEQETVRKAQEELKDVLGETESPTNSPVRTGPEEMILVDTAVKTLDRITDSLLNAKESSVGPEAKIQYEKTKEAAIKVVQNTVSRLETQTNSLRTIASTGALMFIFTHEAQSVISSLDTHANELEIRARNMPDKEKKLLLNLSKSFRETRDRFDDQIRLFSRLSDDIKKVERKRLNVNNSFKQVKNVFAGFIKDFNVEIDDKIDPSHRTGLMLEPELYSILINLLSNALKAVLACESSNKKIKIETFENDDSLVLRVYDDGVGLKKEYRELVKQPLVSDPEGKLYKNLKGKIDERTLTAVGSGRGLGLSIVGSILESYNKQLNFIDAEEPWKTCVEVELP